MKMIYILLLALILTGLFYFLKNKSVSDKPAEMEITDGGLITRTKTQDNKYADLRAMVFTVTPEILNLTLPKDKTIVYGTVMDWNHDGVTVTVVSFQTGDASMYLSSGQIFIGGYAHETVKKSATDLVACSQTYLSKTEKVSSTRVADKDCVRFYFLTNHGTFTHQEMVVNILQPANEWAQLHNLGQNVIAQYRLITADK